MALDEDRNRDLDDRRVDRVVAEFLAQEEAGHCPDPEAWLRRHPDLHAALASFFRNHQACRRADALSVASSGEGRPEESDASEKVAELVRAGDVVGDCRITRMLGRGGMGVVYQAEHVRLKDLRALKFLPRGTVTDSMLRRFWREAQTAASIKHPNVIGIHDVGQQDDLHYIVMEYVEGHTVAQFCRKEIARRPDHRFPWTTAVNLIIPVLDALCAVHRRGLVHRDVKPSNIMVNAAPLSAGGMHVTLMDFGLVQDETEQGLTESGHIVGTPAYMSPEQALGWRTDERSDVFAVGATLYFMLTGQHPHVGSKTVVLARSAAGLPPIPLSRLRPDLLEEACRIVERAMSPRASRRYSGTQELIADLKRSLQHVGSEDESAEAWLSGGAARDGVVDPLQATAAYQPADPAPEIDTLKMQLVATAADPASSSRAAFSGILSGEKDPSSLTDILQQRWPWLRWATSPAVWGAFAVGAAALLIALVMWIGQSMSARGNAKQDRAPPAHPQVAAPVVAQPSREGMVFIPAGIAHLGADESRLRAHAETIPACKGKPEMVEQFVAKCMREPEDSIPLEGFWIDQYEVTNAQYAEFLRATGHLPPPTWINGQPPAGKDDHPVVNVRHADAAAYAAWAGKQLPTAAQWLRAFRGDDLRMYPWGDNWVGNRANVVENKMFPMGTCPVKATPLDASPFNVFNLAGNASEIMRERTIEEGETTTITKGGDADSLGSVYGAAPFRYLLIGEEAVQKLTGFRCVIEER